MMNQQQNQENAVSNASASVLINSTPISSVQVGTQNSSNYLLTQGVPMDPSNNFQQQQPGGQHVQAVNTALYYNQNVSYSSFSPAASESLPQQHYYPYQYCAPFVPSQVIETAAPIYSEQNVVEDQFAPQVMGASSQVQQHHTQTPLSGHVFQQNSGHFQTGPPPPQLDHLQFSRSVDHFGGPQHPSMFHQQMRPSFHAPPPGFPNFNQSPQIPPGFSTQLVPGLPYRMLFPPHQALPSFDNPVPPQQISHMHRQQLRLNLPIAHNQMNYHHFSPLQFQPHHLLNQIGVRASGHAEHTTPKWQPFPDTISYLNTPVASQSLAQYSSVNFQAHHSNEFFAQNQFMEQTTPSTSSYAENTFPNISNQFERYFPNSNQSQPQIMFFEQNAQNGQVSPYVHPEV